MIKFNIQFFGGRGSGSGMGSRGGAAGSEASTSSSSSGETIINGNRVYKDGDDWIVESADGSWDGYEMYDSREEAMQAARQGSESEFTGSAPTTVGGSTVGNINVYMSGGNPVQGYRLPSSASKQDMLAVAREGEFHNSTRGTNSNPSRSLVIDAGNGAIQHEARITESGGEYDVMVSGKYGSFGGSIQTRKSLAAAERTARKMLEKQINSTYDYESKRFLKR